MESNSLNYFCIFEKTINHMKKALFLLLTSGLLAAQSSDLLSTNWYISSIIVNGQSVTTPTMDNSLQPSYFMPASGNGYTFASKYFNTAGTQITFIPNSDSFTKSSGGCTLADYWGGNMAAVQEYDQKNCDFFTNPNAGNIYNYLITSNGIGKTLMITDSSNGNKVYYNSFYLNTKENNIIKKSFSAYPNPAKESLTIENIDKNLSIKVYDLSGKLVLETKSNDQKVKIETSSLQKGQYIVAIENYAPYKFTKE